MEQRFVDPSERLTPVEAEAVLKRFREEEELRQREIDAAATNPTVADLAEGLGVPPERVASLLSQVRSVHVPEAPVSHYEAKQEVQRAHRSAWVIAATILGVVLILAVLTAVVVVAPARTVETPAPEAPSGTAAPDIPGADLATPMSD